MNDINFTFGIITDAQNGVNDFLPRAVQSIRELHIPKYEIIIVGTKREIIKHEILSPDSRLTIIDFDESIKAKWITKKKNLITKNAKYDNIVYQHDYVTYDKNWYNGWKEFGDDYVACMNVIKNLDGTRYRDWVIFPDSFSEDLRNYANIQNNESMLPYDDNRFIKWQYFSGAYWVAKKWLMKEIPLEEFLVWGEGEDVRWSHYVRSKYDLKMNPHSTVQILKQHNPAFGPIRKECYDKIIEYYNKIQNGEIKDWWQIHEDKIKNGTIKWW